jgi:phage terminase large subunit
MAGGYRYFVLYGGRGSGKSHTLARIALIKGMEKATRIVCLREVQNAISDSVHRLLADLIKEYDLEYFYTVQNDKIIGKNGTLFIFKGLKHNVSGIKSLEGCDIAWAEEAENITDHSWEILIPTIRKENSQLWISFNTRYSSDPTYQRFVKHDDPDIWCQKVSFRDNPFFPEILEKERRRLEINDPDAYAHVWEGEPDTRRTGFIYAKQIHQAREQGRLAICKYDPGSEVYMGCDLGFGDSTDIWWWQFVGRELRFINYYSNVGEQLEHYVKIIKDKPYNYAAVPMYLPHDGAHGNIRGESVARQLSRMGVKNIVLEREADITPGIELVRQMLSFSVFDSQFCKEGIHALEHYRYQWDEDKKIFRSKPLHDWASNGADAMRSACRGAARVKNFMGAAAINKFDPFDQYDNSASWMGG